MANAIQWIQNPAYEKDHCIEPGGYIAVLFPVTRLSSFLIFVQAVGG